MPPQYLFLPFEEQAGLDEFKRVFLGGSEAMLEEGEKGRGGLSFKLWEVRLNWWFILRED